MTRDNKGYGLSNFSRKITLYSQRWFILRSVSDCKNMCNFLSEEFEGQFCSRDGN